MVLGIGVADDKIDDLLNLILDGGTLLWCGFLVAGPLQFIIQKAPDALMMQIWIFYIDLASVITLATWVMVVEKVRAYLHCRNSTSPHPTEND